MVLGNRICLYFILLLIERTVYRTEYAVFLGGFLTLFYFFKKLECENKREVSDIGESVL